MTLYQFRERRYRKFIRLPTNSQNWTPAARRLYDLLRSATPSSRLTEIANLDLIRVLFEFENIEPLRYPIRFGDTIQFGDPE